MTIGTINEAREIYPDELRPDDAARYVGISRTYLYALLAHEAISSRYERGARWIRCEDLDRLKVARGTVR
jgi:hypothetical protein